MTTLTNMKKRWVFREDQQSELAKKLAQKQAKELAGELNIAEELSSLLCNRNAETFEKAKQFFRPDLSQLHDPFLMKDMTEAVKRIETAINKGEKILVYGDYDVDGTTAVSLVYSFIKSMYDNVDYYIPDRELEGYGISYIGINWAKEQGITLIIALDCGIKSIEHVKYASDIKIDFIIADHHVPGATLPTAIAVLDPKRNDCTYPFKELSGCGIGYKLVTALVNRLKLPALTAGLYLDMLAISIAADVVEVCDENRILAYYGLKQLNEKPCIGLKVLIESILFKEIKKSTGVKSLKKPAGLKSEITFNEVLFQLGPRINAAGRMKKATLVVELLTSTDQKKAEALCIEINEWNDKRKLEDTAMSGEAFELLKKTPDWETQNSTVLYQENWHKGVVGIVASRIIEKHYRPTIILTGRDGKASGSARSVSGFNIYAAIESCQHLLEQFGGHEFAAGMTLNVDKIDEFRLEFEKAVTKSMHKDGFIRELNIDHEIDPAILDGKFTRILLQFAPFGPGNHQPVFKSKNLKCHGTPSIVAKEHLKFQIYVDDRTQFTCMGFNMKEYYADLIDPEKSFDLCYSVENNSWNGKNTIQLLIKDLQIHTH